MIVTHQKRTLDAADVLYGVSMGEDGVTRVVSRRMPREAEAAEPGAPTVAEAPPPFAGITTDREPGDEDAPSVGAAPGDRAAGGDSPAVEAA